jgi:hypothetical protein
VSERENILLSDRTSELVRLGARLYECNERAFVEVAISEYLETLEPASDAPTLRDCRSEHGPWGLNEEGKALCLYCGFSPSGES